METIDDYYAGESTIPEDANVPMGGYAGGDLFSRNNYPFPKLKKTKDIRHHG